LNLVHVLHERVEAVGPGGAEGGQAQSSVLARGRHKIPSEGCLVGVRVAQFKQVKVRVLGELTNMPAKEVES
jgi:hypothetical protein